MTSSSSVKGYIFESLSGIVLESCIDVQRQMGVRCMEVDYQRALVIAFKKLGLHGAREVTIPIILDAYSMGYLTPICSRMASSVAMTASDSSSGMVRLSSAPARTHSATSMASWL